MILTNIINQYANFFNVCIFRLSIVNIFVVPKHLE